MASKHNKIGLYTVQAALVVIFFILGYLIWSLARPYNPADATTPMEVKNKIVKKGEPIILSIDSCTHKQTVARIEIEILGKNSNAALPVFTIDNVTTEVGCKTDAIFPVPTTQLPFELPTGEYRVRLHTTYKVNSYRDVVEDYDSEVFQYNAE